MGFVDGQVVFVNKTAYLYDATLWTADSNPMQYGKVPFTGTRGYVIEGRGFGVTPGHQAIFRLNDHLRRYKEGTKTLDMATDWGFQYMNSQTGEIVKVMNWGMVRQMFLNAIPLNFAPDEDNLYIRAEAVQGRQLGVSVLKDKGSLDVNSVIIVAKVVNYVGGSSMLVSTTMLPTLPENVAAAGFKIFPPNLKASGKYLLGGLAKNEANSLGCSEPLMLSVRYDMVTGQVYVEVGEASGANLIIVKNGKMYTPPLSAGILKGITRKTVMSLYEVVERPISLKDLLEADEVFLCGSAAQITKIEKFVFEQKHLENMMLEGLVQDLPQGVERTVEQVRATGVRTQVQTVEFAITNKQKYSWVDQIKARYENILHGRISEKDPIYAKMQRENWLTPVPKIEDVPRWMVKEYERVMKDVQYRRALTNGHALGTNGEAKKHLTNDSTGRQTSGFLKYR